MSKSSIDLLPAQFSPHERRRRQTVRAVLWIGGSALVFVVAATLALVLPAVGAVRALVADAQAGRSALERAQSSAESLDFKAASAALGDAQGSFESAQADLGRLGWIADLPYIKNEAAAARLLVAGGRDTAYALKEAVDVGVDLLAVAKTGIAAGPDLSSDQRPVAELSREDRRALLAQLQAAPERLARSREALDRALGSFDQVQRTAMTSGILDSLDPYRQKLTELRALLARDLGPLARLPELVGYPEPKTYLFLLLNNTELRPGGGFLGSYGVIKVADGGLESFTTDDVYSLDGPSEAWLKEAPPEPIRRYLTKLWFMRDANWSPDFVVSAQNIERFYHLEKGPVERFDGVIGITPTLIARLLEITGPITVGDSRFDSANITDELEYQVEKGFAQSGTPYFQRKAVVGQLGDELVRRLLQLPLSRLPEVLTAADQAVRGKQLMASFADPDIMAYADSSGWTGRLAAASGDALMAVDANLGALKTDAVMERTISYSIRPDGSGYLARAAVTYRNNGHFDWKTSRYRTYTRFYVPAGSTLVRGEGMMRDDKLNDPRRLPGTIDVGTDLGRAVFGGFIAIEPGETRTLAVEYRLPEPLAQAIRAGAYRLDVGKQLGADDHKLTLDLDFGKKLTRAEPPEPAAEWGDGRYKLETDLRTDRTFTVATAK